MVSILFGASIDLPSVFDLYDFMIQTYDIYTIFGMNGCKNPSDLGVNTFRGFISALDVDSPVPVEPPFPASKVISFNALLSACEKADQWQASDPRWSASWTHVAATLKHNTSRKNTWKITSKWRRRIEAKWAQNGDWSKLVGSFGWNEHQEKQRFWVESQGAQLS